MSEYSIWVLEYSYVTNYHKSGVLYGAHNEGHVKLPYCYVLIQGNGHNILVDVGFNNKEYGEVLGDKYGVENWHSPEDVLAEVGVSPKEIDSVFVTHAHFDHFGNVEDFPNATFYMQEEEISKWMWVMSLPHEFDWLTTAFDPNDIVRGAQLAKDGRLVLIDGDRENVLPGIDVHAAKDTHTFGSQFVVVRSSSDQQDEDAWILAGDLAYVFDNIEGRDQDGVYVPVGLATGSQTNLILTTDKMMKLVGHDSSRIIPIHEQRLVERFPSRVSDKGLHIVEVVLAEGIASKVD